MERIFKTLFVLGIIVFCILIVSLFMLFLKFLLLFNQQINLFGMTIQ